ncbi:MAG: hypothetical protein HQK53_18135 [Oligoflexia bacterium]|nr:hypothetical protein [Oligoflexia bacterium]
MDGNFLTMENETQLKDWLVHFGEILSPIEPEIEKVNEQTIGTGRLRVKMKLEIHVPQFVPIYGQKVKFHYRGIKKLCTSCYNTGHYRAECDNEKIMWLTYVALFMERFPEIEKEMYGKWASFLENEGRRVKAGKTSKVIDELRKLDEGVENQGDEARQEKDDVCMEVDGEDKVNDNQGEPDCENDSDYVDVDVNESQETTENRTEENNTENLKNKVSEAIVRYESKTRGRGRGRAPTGWRLKRGGRNK